MEGTSVDITDNDKTRTTRYCMSIPDAFNLFTQEEPPLKCFSGLGEVLLKIMIPTVCISKITQLYNVLNIRINRYT